MLSHFVLRFGRLLSDNRVSHCWTGLFSFPPLATNLIIFAWLLICSFACSFFFHLTSGRNAERSPRFYYLDLCRRSVVLSRFAFFLPRVRKTFPCEIMLLIFPSFFHQILVYQTITSRHFTAAGSDDLCSSRNSPNETTHSKQTPAAEASSNMSEMLFIFLWWSMIPSFIIMRS